MTVRETYDVDAPRVVITRVLQGDRYVVAIEVEALRLPGDDELSFGPTVWRFLGEARRHVDAGDVEWLRRHGKVYVALDDAA